jgi:hypothetical protein
MEILTPEMCGHLAVPRTVPTEMRYPFTAQARPWGSTETGRDAACRLYKVLGILRTFYEICPSSYLINAFMSLISLLVIQYT